MQHNSITLTRSREPVFPQEPIEDEARPQRINQILLQESDGRNLFFGNNLAVVRKLAVDNP